MVDNDTIFVEDGKIKSKSVPFDGGSIFACLAGNKEGVFINEGDGVNNQQMWPNLSDSSFQKSQDGKSFCHIEDNAIVLDEECFYIVRLRRAFYPDVSNTNEMDLTQSISYKPVGSSAFSVIGTQTLRMNNDPDLWQYCDFSIVLHGKVGDAISTVSYEPVVAGVTVYSGSFGLYVFKIPTTNEYQVSNSEYMGIYQTQHTVIQTTQNSDNQNQKYFDIRWDTDSTVNEFPDRLAIKNNIELVPYKSGIVLWNFYCSIGTKYGVSVTDKHCDDVVDVLNKEEENIINIVIDEYAKKSPMSLYRILYGEISWNNSRKHIDERGIGRKMSNEDIRKDAIRIKEREKFLSYFRK